MRKIGALIFPGFELLDLFGPLQMFGMLEKRYAIELISENGGAVASGQGPSAFSDTRVEADARYDVLFIPGGMGTRGEVGNTRLLEWIAETSARAELTVSVCTGSALLGRAGVLDGRRATTNKGAFDWVEAQAPRVHWVRKARWVEDGPYVTSSGVSAGIDMALGVIARLDGGETAEKVARWSEYRWAAEPDDDPFAVSVSNP